MSLLEDLRQIVLGPAEIPSGAELDKVVAGIVKTLEHAGTTVADDLLPKPEAAVADVAVTEAGNLSEHELEKLIGEAESKLAALRSQPQQPAAEPAPPSSEPTSPPIEGAQ